jgi:hypothetical protein
VALGLTVSSRAGLGWTLDETIAHYGQPEVSDVPTGDARKEYKFTKVDGNDGSHYMYSFSTAKPLAFLTNVMMQMVPGLTSPNRS